MIASFSRIGRHGLNPRDGARARALEQHLKQFAETRPLPGLNSDERMVSLLSQLIDSLRRIEFAHYLRDKRHVADRADPISEIFDPLRAAVIQNRQGNSDEAWWLVFLATHFGKHEKNGWRFVRDIYGQLGQGGRWDWATVARNPAVFGSWLTMNEAALKASSGRFSNHRKYESLLASARNGTPAIIISYVAWVAPYQSHNKLIRQLHRKVGQDPEAVFAALYHSMDAVLRFGRLGKFDFLTMLGKLGIAPIEPGSAFLSGATGPLAGARLLFGGAPNAPLSSRLLDQRLIELGNATGLGMQVLEDALCNWQKSPETYQRFKG